MAEGMPIKLTDLDINGKRLLIREDYNIPLKDGRILHDARIAASLPTIRYAIEKNASVLLMSHLGRPEAGRFEPSFSLRPIAEYLTEALGQKVKFFPDWEQGDAHLAPGEVGLCENVRFAIGEEEDDPLLAKRMAKLCDVFVMDAFAVAHRAQASTYGVARFAPLACAGPLLVAELEALSKALAAPEPPLLAIVGGAKVSTKLKLLESLLRKVDTLIVGGGIANTFLAATGCYIGLSLHEPSLIPVAERLLEQAKLEGKKIILPQDCVVAANIDSKGEIKTLDQIGSKDAIYDLGPLTCETIATEVLNAKTILWNGPLGVFEVPEFAAGTRALAAAIAKSPAFSIAGGGDTLLAIDMFSVAEKISYISTGGGAFLESVEGKLLPGVAVLLERAKHA